MAGVVNHGMHMRYPEDMKVGEEGRPADAVAVQFFMDMPEDIPAGEVHFNGIERRYFVLGSLEESLQQRERRLEDEFPFLHRYCEGCPARAFLYGSAREEDPAFPSNKQRDGKLARRYLHILLEHHAMCALDVLHTLALLWCTPSQEDCELFKVHLRAAAEACQALHLFTILPRHRVGIPYRARMHFVNTVFSVRFKASSVLDALESLFTYDPKYATCPSVDHCRYGKWSVPLCETVADRTSYTHLRFLVDKYLWVPGVQTALGRFLLLAPSETNSQRTQLADILEGRDTDHVLLQGSGSKRSCPFKDKSPRKRAMDVNDLYCHEDSICDFFQPTHE